MSKAATDYISYNSANIIWNILIYEKYNRIYKEFGYLLRSFYEFWWNFHINFTYQFMRLKQKKKLVNKNTLKNQAYFFC